MGCSNSKIDNEEAVQICKDRKRFIREALEQRFKFATGHVAYINALKRVSVALRDFVLGGEHQELIFNLCANPAFRTLKFYPETAKSTSSVPIKFGTSNPPVVNYLRSGGNPSVSIEERPESPETVRIETYAPSPTNSHGIDGFFSFQSPVNSSFFSSPNNKPNLPPQSPQASPWDFFWNPFSSLDSYGYPTRNSLDQTIDDEITGLKQVREEEGIPDLEEEEEEEEEDIGKGKSQVVEEKMAGKKGHSSNNENSTDKDGVFTSKEASANLSNSMDDIEFEIGDPGSELKGFQSQTTEGINVSEAQNAVELDVANEDEDEDEGDDDHRESNVETPGFTVYLSQTPTSIAEVIKNIENQFIIACDSAKEVSTMLEVNNVKYSSTPNEITAIKILNPVALFRSASSRSSSSRTFHASCSSREDGYDSSSDFSEESCMFSGSHHSTLDRLYAWEKKLYEEVKSGERIRIAYEKKCMQMRNQDAKGADFSDVEKTRIALRDLHTQIKVSIHSVETVAKRIETLRDEELQPQLMELIQGLARMWRVMAECHQAQKQILHAAAGISNSLVGFSPENHRRSTMNLQIELQNWETCFSSWISSQRAYVRALNSWLLRCLHLDSFSPSMPKIPFSPQRIGAPPIFSLCLHWCNLTGKVQEFPVIDSLKTFSIDLRSLYEQQQEEVKQKRKADQLDGKLRVMYRSESKRLGLPEASEVVGESGRLLARREMEIESFRKEVEVERERQRDIADRTAENAVRVLLEGLGGVVSYLAEFTVNSAEGCEELVKYCERMGRTGRISL